MRLTIQAGTVTEYKDGSEITKNIYYQNFDELMKEFEKQKSEFKNPNITENDIMKLAEKSQDSKRIQKLGQYEDIEEELGIDLVTLIKVLDAVLRKEYLWTKYNDKLCATNDVFFGDEYNGVLFIYFYWNNGKHLTFELKDYGKTWALTKEELE